MPAAASRDEGVEVERPRAGSGVLEQELPAAIEEVEGLARAPCGRPRATPTGPSPRRARRSAPSRWRETADKRRRQIVEESLQKIAASGPIRDPSFWANVGHPLCYETDPSSASYDSSDRTGTPPDEEKASPATQDSALRCGPACESMPRSASRSRRLALLHHQRGARAVRRHPRDPAQHGAAPAGAGRADGPLRTRKTRSTGT